MLKINLMRRFAATVLSCTVMMVMGGCAGAKYQPEVISGPLPKPDMVVVENFAVTANEVQLDKGIAATAMRDSEPGAVNAEEERVGHMVADQLAQSLVEELRKEGINAVRAGAPIHATSTTAFLSGEFLTVNQGNQSARFWIGFGLGGSKIKTHLQVVQNGVLVASGETSTKSSLKPGMVAGIAGGGAGLAVGAATGGISEAFLATVKQDAERTAKAVAKQAKQAYVDRGWLAN
jgi:hypothetical protein